MNQSSERLLCSGRSKSVLNQGSFKDCSYEYKSGKKKKGKNRKFK